MKEHTPSCLLVLLAILALFSAPLLAAEQQLRFGSTHATEIWFIRHAESEINVTNTRPELDEGMSYPLTKRGMDQANVLADRLKNIPVLAIYASTRLRTIQTADAVAFRVGMPIILAPEMVEINIGIKKGTTDAAKVWKPLAKRWLTDPTARYGEGESVVDLRNRVVPFVHGLMERYRGDNGVVLVVAHGGSIQLGVESLCENTIARRTAQNAPMPYTGVLKTAIEGEHLVCQADWMAEKKHGETK